jgi:hypothetical protein
VDGRRMVMGVGGIGVGLDEFGGEEGRIVG